MRELDSALERCVAPDDRLGGPQAVERRADDAAGVTGPFADRDTGPRTPGLSSECSSRRKPHRRAAAGLGPDQRRVAQKRARASGDPTAAGRAVERGRPPAAAPARARSAGTTPRG